MVNTVDFYTYNNKPWTTIVNQGRLEEWVEAQLITRHTEQGYDKTS